MQYLKKGYDFVADELRSKIQQNIYNPGDKLPTIEQLAKEYRAGRSTIREALGLLRAEGLIESIQGGGTFVIEKPLTTLHQSGLNVLTSASELTQLLQVRKMMEVGSIGLAAANRSRDDIERLRKIVNQMKLAIGNEEASQLHDVHFHMAIARAAHNQLLEDLMEQLSVAMTRTIRDSRKLWLYSQQESAAQLYAEHEQMLLTIEQGDEVGAGAIMRAHLERVEAAFRANVGSHKK